MQASPDLTVPVSDLMALEISYEVVMQLSVLDQSPIGPGEDAATAVAHTIELASRCDDLGYHRYWLAEHHASKTLASSAPEILIARVANETRHIRVGSGGVMLSHYSPYKVAENFRLLEVMYPGRIDLGVGRAPGSDGVTAAALAYGNKLGIEYYPTKVRDMLAWVSSEKPYSEAFGNLAVSPAAETVPEVWVLASSPDSARYAAYFGLPLSFAHFIAPEQATNVMHTYRAEFNRDSGREPRAALGVFAIAHDDPDRVDLLRRARELQKIRRESGQQRPAPTLEEAAAHPFTDKQIERMRSKRSRQIIGEPEAVRAEIEALVVASGADEVVVLTITPSFVDRVRSYELLAGAFGLSPPT